MESQPKIFINYRRRGDAPGFAKQLYEDLEARFGREHLFKDLHNIPPGEDFVERFSKEVDSCRVFLVVIGKEWLSILGKKRAEKKKDFVYLELLSALGRRAQNNQSILIIPVLVDGADMPGELDLPDDLKRLATLNEFPLPEEYWEAGIDRLVKQLSEVLGITPKTQLNSRSSHTVSEQTPQAIKGISKSKELNIAFGVVGGGIGGLLTGALVGGIYSRQYVDIPGWRFIIAGAVGLVVGAIGAAFIGYGIKKLARLLKGAWYAKIIGGALGGTLGGVPMIILGGMIFYWSGRNNQIDPVLEAMAGGWAVNPLLIGIAVVASSFFIALGLLAPARHQMLASLFIVACVTVLILIVTIGVMAANLDGFKRSLSGGSLKSLIFNYGLLPGLVAGLQVSFSLLSSDWFSREAAGD